MPLIILEKLILGLVGNLSFWRLPQKPETFHRVILENHITVNLSVDDDQQPTRLTKWSVRVKWNNIQGACDSRNDSRLNSTFETQTTTIKVVITTTTAVMGSAINSKNSHCIRNSSSNIVATGRIAYGLWTWSNPSGGTMLVDHSRQCVALKVWFQLGKSALYCQFVLVVNICCCKTHLVRKIMHQNFSYNMWKLI